MTQEHRFREAIEFLQSGGTRGDVPRHEGRADLRRLPLSDPTYSNIRTVVGVEIGTPMRKALELRNCEIRSADFSRCKLLAASVKGCNLTDCRFDNSNCSSMNMTNSVFDDCTFLGTNLWDTYWGAGPRTANVFRRCTFVRAKMRRLLISAARFENCTFEECDLHDTMILACSFIDTRFIGRLHGVSFFGGTSFQEFGEKHRIEVTPEFSGLDLRQTDFRISDIRRLDDDSGFLWPEDPDLLIIENYAGLLDEILDWLKTRTLEHKGPMVYFQECRRTAGRLGVHRLSDLRSTPALQPQDVHTLVAMFEASARKR
jgi:uncharacterized protein YjbI with pentapeptide repeats